MPLTGEGSLLPLVKKWGYFLFKPSRLCSTGKNISLQSSSKRSPSLNCRCFLEFKKRSGEQRWTSVNKRKKTETLRAGGPSCPVILAVRKNGQGGLGRKDPVDSCFDWSDRTPFTISSCIKTLQVDWILGQTGTDKSLITNCVLQRVLMPKWCMVSKPQKVILWHY